MTRPTLALALMALPCGAQVWIGSPDAAPTWVDAAGVLHEPWGQVSLDSDPPAEWRAAPAAEPGPLFVRTATVAGCTLTQRIFRAPIWSGGCDVLALTAVNRGTAPAELPVRLVLPEAAEVSDGLATLGGGTIARFDPAIAEPAEKRAWGYFAGGSRLAGWGRPAVPCDPAFANIRAGLGGVRLGYQFEVRPGSRWTVALGLMESHWSRAGQRPVILQVEGEEPLEVDPIALWGQHQPGVVLFDARDLNADGALTVEVLPVEGCPDENTILNAIWLFDPALEVDARQVVRGEWTERAARYVDVGGEQDQSLYVGRQVAYRLALPPGASRTLHVALASPAGGVPDADEWPLADLTKAADDVWRGWFAAGAELSLGDPAALAGWRNDLALLAMAREQANDYYAAVPGPGGLGQFSHSAACLVTGGLDLAGQHFESRRLLRLVWDRPVPEPFAAFVSDGGTWRDATGTPEAGAWALLALSTHARMTGDDEWARAVLPAARMGALALAAAPLTPEQAFVARLGVRAAAQLAEVAGADSTPLRRAYDALPAGTAPPARPATAPCAAAAERLMKLRNAIVHEDGALTLLDGADPAWLAGDGIVARDLPTGFGPLALTARADGARVTVTVDPPTRAAPPALRLVAPTIAGRRPTAARVNGAAAGVTDGRVALQPTGRSTVTLLYDEL